MLDYIIIGLLIIVIILVIIAISKNVNEGKITERLGTLETTTVKELSSFQIDIMKTMNDNFNGLNERIEKKLSQINDKVNERLDDNFAKTNKTFTNILERLSRIDEAQKKIDTLSTDNIPPDKEYNATVSISVSEEICTLFPIREMASASVPTVVSSIDTATFFLDMR